MKQPYNAIACLYEKIMGEDVDYEKWADYIIGTLKEYSPGKTGADVGCGSGVFTRKFKRGGYNVCGFDVSDEMLAEAIKQTRKEGLDINYIKQDMRSFKSMGKVHFITALTDCFNYVDGGGMEKTFRRFSASLVKGGVLIFDISTEYKLKNIIGNNLFGEDCEEFSYLWFNNQIDGGVEMDISLFTKDADGKYIKSEENHIQYIHTENEIISALDVAGFDLVRKEGHLGEVLTPESQRINFVAIRR